MFFFTIRTRLILVLTLILLSGFFITNVISYRASKRQIHSSIIENSLPLARDNIYSEILRDLARPIFVSSLMANDTFLKDWVKTGENQPAQIIRYLTEIRKKYGFFSSFSYQISRKTIITSRAYSNRFIRITTMMSGITGSKKKIQHMIWLWTPMKRNRIT